MKKIFIDGNDKYVGATIVFGEVVEGDTNQYFLWADAAHSVELKAEDVMHAFKVGKVLIDCSNEIDGTIFYVAEGLTFNEEEGPFLLTALDSTVAWGLGTAE